MSTILFSSETSKSIQNLLHTHPECKNELENFAKAIIDNNPGNIKSRCTNLNIFKPINIVESMQSIMGSLDIEQMKKKLKELALDEDFTSVVEHARKMGLPPQKISQNASTIHSTYGNSFPFIFVENFINIFTASFNFFTPDEPPPSLYDARVFLEIYMIFFQIPRSIAWLLKPVIETTVKVYVVTSIVFVVGLAAVCAYLKWLKPFPARPFFCEDIGNLARQKYPNGILGSLREEMKTVLARLNYSPACTDRDPLMIDGKSGVGKSTLAYLLHLMIENNDPDLPDSFQGAKVVYINMQEMMAETNYKIPFGAKMKCIIDNLKALKGDRRLIVIVDEVQAVANDPRCYGQTQEFFRLSEMDMIAITTSKEREAKIQQKDISQAFERPFNIMHFRDWMKSRVEALLSRLAYNEADDVPFDKTAIEKAMDLTRNSPSTAWYPEAAKLLRSAINEVRTNFTIFIPRDLQKSKDELETSQNYRGINYPNSASDDDKAIKNLVDKIKYMENEREKVVKEVHCARMLFQLYAESKNKLIQAHHQVFDSKTPTLDVDLERQYLFNLLCTRVFKSMADKEIKNLETNKKMKLTVNGSLVEKIYICTRLTAEELQTVESLVPKFANTSQTDNSGYSSLVNQTWTNIPDEKKSGFLKNVEGFQYALECLVCDP